MLPIDYLLFLQIAFFLTITPGTPRVVIVIYAINYGLKRSVITAIGDVSANTLQMILIAFGAGVLISAYPNILNYLRWAGILYLLYIAFDLVKSSKSLDFDKSLSTKSNFSLFKDGFLIAFLSPKAWIFFWSYISTIFKLRRRFYYSINNFNYFLGCSRFFDIDALWFYCTENCKLVKNKSKNYKYNFRVCPNNYCYRYRFYKYLIKLSQTPNIQDLLLLFFLKVV
jgi:threonine/homoserine/homoserine lactone efflux protein